MKREAAYRNNVDGSALARLQVFDRPREQNGGSYVSDDAGDDQIIFCSVVTRRSRDWKPSVGLANRKGVTVRSDRRPVRETRSLRGDDPRKVCVEANQRRLGGFESKLPHAGYSIVDDQPLVCPQLCVFQRYFSGQMRYELLGNVELMANGSGRKLFLVYDYDTDKLNTFEAWGEASFLDLDADGEDEFLIEFRGQHLNWPDAAVVRVENGELEMTRSLLEAERRNQGDYATIIRDRTPPIIRISNIRTENEPVYDYEYDHGVLHAVEHVNVAE